MTIVVTGAGGFVGHALVERLLAEGHLVTAIDVRLDHVAPAASLHRVEGDIGDAAVRAAGLSNGCDALVHLATVPGGAAEADPELSRRINVDAMYALLDGARAIGGCPRIVYASSIAVFGDPLPPDGVDDATPLVPKLVYAGHKAMMEVAVAMMSHRGEIDGVTLRLPAILARPPGPSGMKSAFMSDVFHALRESRPYVCPVGPAATIWAESVAQITTNLCRALTVDSVLLPPSRAVTLPALRIAIADLVDEIAAQTGADRRLIAFRPDTALEAAFGRHPVLRTALAERMGFTADRGLPELVGRALDHIAMDVARDRAG